MPFMDYLLAESIDGVILDGRATLVKIPSPAHSAGRRESGIVPRKILLCSRKRLAIQIHSRHLRWHFVPVVPPHGVDEHFYNCSTATGIGHCIGKDPVQFRQF
jgi:hypothetical protein